MQLRGYAKFQRHNPVSTQLSADVEIKRGTAFQKQKASDREADSSFCTTLSLSWCSYLTSMQAHVPVYLLECNFA